MNSNAKRKYWGIVSPHMPANILAQVARQQEDAGLEGTFAVQVFGPPFIPLAVAATSTERLKLASGIVWDHVVDWHAQDLVTINNIP